MRERCFPVPVLAILSLGHFQHTPVELLVFSVDKKVVSMGHPLQVSPSTSQPEEGNTHRLLGMERLSHRSMMLIGMDIPDY